MLTALMRSRRRVEPNTIEGRLRFLANASALLSLGLCLYIVRYKLQLDEFFPTAASIASLNRWACLINAKSGPITLSGTAIFWLLAWRREYTWQLSTAKSLFPPSRVPRDMSSALGAYLWSFMTVAFNVTFLVLVWCIDKLLILSIGILIIGVIAVVSEGMTRINLRKHFTDVLYGPLPNDDHARFIVRRRKVIERYYFERPHAARHACSIGLSSLAALTAIGYARGMDLLPVGVAYGAIALVVFGNEVVVFPWRAIRNKQLAAINEEQMIADEERLRKA